MVHAMENHFPCFFGQNLTLKSKQRYPFGKKNCGHHEDIYLFNDLQIHF